MARTGSDENVGGLGLLFCRRDTHVMSASRPILVVARVVEALPRLAADHVPHALAQRLARGLDLGGQFAYYERKTVLTKKNFTW